MIFKQIDVKDINSIRLLRCKILYPNMNTDISEYDGDLSEGTSHYALCSDTEDLIAIASMFNQKFKHFPKERAIRLRGMAVKNDLQGTGYGKKLLKEIINVYSSQFDLIWCNAREGALGFYKNFGFTVSYEKFVIENIGAHYHAYLRLEQGD